ncbi:MAG: hypothetical protein ACTSO5_10610 [Candidatus Heimdallarchaeaceae archaeon]
MVLNRVGKALRIISDEERKKIAVVIDGPTILQDFSLSRLKSLKKLLDKIGIVRTGKIITDTQISQRDSDLLKAQGFHEEIVGSDVDIHVSIRALEMMNNEGIDIVAIGTADTNLFPILSQIKHKKSLAVITWEKDITPAIESAADMILTLDLLK